MLPLLCQPAAALQAFDATRESLARRIAAVDAAISPEV
jgi:hypothetical protein